MIIAGEFVLEDGVALGISGTASETSVALEADRILVAACKAGLIALVALGTAVILLVLPPEEACD